MMVERRGITRKQAADFFGISPSTLSKYVREGKIPPPSLPGRRYDILVLQNVANTMSGISGAPLGRNTQPDDNDWNVAL